MYLCMCLCLCLCTKTRATGKKGERGDYCLWCILQQHVREALDPKGYVQITPRYAALRCV